MNHQGSGSFVAWRDAQPGFVGIAAAGAVFTVVAALTVVRFWRFTSPLPSGLDGAQWLSYGRSLPGGVGRSAESVYPPLIPWLTEVFNLLVGPLVGLRLLGAAVLVLLVIAVWKFSVRVLGMMWGSLATALVIPASAIAEPFYYGGYPQQAALAFGLVGMTGIVEASGATTSDLQKRALRIAALGFTLASASHLLLGPLLLTSGGFLIVMIGIGRHNHRFLSLAMVSLLPATAVSLLVAFAFLSVGYAAPLAISKRTLPAAWAYATREAPVLWTAIMVLGVSYSLALVLRHQAVARGPGLGQDVPDAVITGLALTLPASGLLIVSGQPRLVPPILIGVSLLVVFAGMQVTARWPRTLPFAVATWTALVCWLAVTTTEISHEFAVFYQVIDHSLIAASRSIPPAAGGAIAVAADRRGWPIGWWVEALQEQPVYVGSNPQWLAFPDERTRADATVNLLASSSSGVLRQRAGELEVTYILLRKWEWIGWDRWLDGSANAPTVIYDDDETIVLNIGPIMP